MSIFIESQLAGMLQDNRLSTKEREHLEELRELNLQYLEENKDYYPRSPYEFGDDHVKSVVELRIGEVYDVLTRRTEDDKFEVADTLKVERITPKYFLSATFPFNLDVQILRTGGIQFGKREASDMGLEPLPAIVLPEEMKVAAGHIWAPDVYTRRSSTSPEVFLS